MVEPDLRAIRSGAIRTLTTFALVLPGCWRGPASGLGYELAGYGRELEDIVLQLGLWGARSMPGCQSRPAAHGRAQPGRGHRERNGPDHRQAEALHGRKARRARRAEGADPAPLLRLARTGRHGRRGGRGERDPAQRRLLPRRVPALERGPPRPGRRRRTRDHPGRWAGRRPGDRGCGRARRVAGSHHLGAALAEYETTRRPRAEAVLKISPPRRQGPAREPTRLATQKRPRPPAARAGSAPPA